MATILHYTGDSRYERLNDQLCVVCGVARRRDIELDVAELVWEPLTERPGGSTET